MELAKQNWTKKDGQEFQLYLKSLGSEKDAPWKQRIINTQLPCLAIKSQVINNIAKEIAKGNFLSFIDLWLWDYFENTSVIAVLISKIKDLSIYRKYLITYISKADNWATTDCLKIRITPKNEQFYFALAQEFLKSNKTFENRTGLGILLKLVANKKYIEDIFKYMDMFEDETEYYVNMMNAWLLCECFIKQRDLTLKYLSGDCHLNKFTINKGISKCRDSFRVSPDDKEYLLRFRKK